MKIKISFDGGEVFETTLAQFVADNADDPVGTEQEIVAELEARGFFVCGGGAAPEVLVTP